MSGDSPDGCACGPIDRIVVDAITVIVRPAIDMLSAYGLNSGNGEWLHLANAAGFLAKAMAEVEAWRDHRARHFHRKEGA